MNTNNRDVLSVSVPPQDLIDTKAKLQSIEQAFSFLIELTPNEVMQLPKINVSNHNFVQETIQVLESQNIPLPNGISLTEIKKDLILYDQLDELSLSYEMMLRKLRNTATLAGSEAYKSALFVYKIVQTYAESGIPGYGAIYERLKQRFASQGQREDDTETKE